MVASLRWRLVAAASGSLFSELRDATMFGRMSRSSLPGQPMTLGNMLDNGLELIIGCEACGNNSVADVATLAERYGRDFPVAGYRAARSVYAMPSYARAYVRVSGYKPPVTS
jgi:hypothetical protein